RRSGLLLLRPSVLLQLNRVPGRIVDPDLHRSRPLDGPLVGDVALLELEDRLVEIFHRDAVVVSGRVDRRAPGWSPHDVQLLVGDTEPVAGDARDVGAI